MLFVLFFTPKEPVKTVTSNNMALSVDKMMDVKSKAVITFFFSFSSAIDSEHD